MRYHIVRGTLDTQGVAKRMSRSKQVQSVLKQVRSNLINELSLLHIKKAAAFIIYEYITPLLGATGKSLRVPMNSLL